MKTINRIKLFIYKFIIKKTINNIDYINGPDILPPPLSNEEEAAAIQNLKNDTSGEIKTKLIEHNLRLVVYIAKKFENTQICIEDLISIGSIGLIKAINTFCPEKQIKLATYASRCIENEILMYLRKNNYIKNEISLDEPLNVDWDGNELLLSDILGGTTNAVDKELEKEAENSMLNLAISKLSSRDKEIINLRFGLSGQDELTQKEVADMMGISQSYISRIEKKIILKLKSEINKM